MATMSHNYTVIHPLYDVPEEKCSSTHLDKIEMSPTVRISLIVLRGYLVLISGLCLYHVLGITGLLAKLK
jgi:hypothetical protein